MLEAGLYLQHRKTLTEFKSRLWWEEWLMEKRCGNIKSTADKQSHNLHSGYGTLNDKMSVALCFAPLSLISFK